MTTTEKIIAITIHLIIPLTGLLIYFGLIKKMKKEKIINPPSVELFLIIATYGSLLVITLTSLIWKWSGMASLGVFYLIMVAPFVMGIIAYRNYKMKKESKYHMLAFRSGIFYFIIAPVLLLTTIIIK